MTLLLLDAHDANVMTLPLHVCLKTLPDQPGTHISGVGLAAGLQGSGWLALGMGL